MVVQDDEFGDIYENEGYKEDEINPRKAAGKKDHRAGDMSRKDAKDFPKVGKYLKDDNTIEQISKRTGVPKDFLKGVGPELGDFVSKYLFMAIGGKGTPLDPQKMKWLKDLRDDVEPLVKAFYTYFVKKQVAKMGLSQDDISKLEQIQQEQGDEAAMMYLQERVGQVQQEKTRKINAPREWQSEDGQTVVRDDSPILIDPNAPPPARLQPNRGGLLTPKQLAERAGLTSESLSPRGDMHVQRAKPVPSDESNIMEMMAQERERIRSKNLYGPAAPASSNSGGAGGIPMGDLSLKGTDEVMKALQEDAEKFKTENEKRMKEAAEKMKAQATQPTRPQHARPQSQIPQVPTVRPFELEDDEPDREVRPVTQPTEVAEPDTGPEPAPTPAHAPELQPQKDIDPDVIRDLPPLAEIKKMKRPSLEQLAVKLGINPKSFRKAELVQCIIETLEGA